MQRFARFKNAILERALGGELTHHLGIHPVREARRHDESSQTGGKTVAPVFDSCIGTGASDCGGPPAD
jgi:hypothetical protein